MVAELRYMDLSLYDLSLFTVLFSIAYFGCFRVSEFLISTDDMKMLRLDRVVFRKDGAFEFLLFKTKNNDRGPV